MAAFISGLQEFQVSVSSVVAQTSGKYLVLMVLALAVACIFEMINGFHDTANAVATVIYTRSLKPWMAVGLSGFLNFLGVFLGGTAVAMGIVKLLPMDLLVSHQVGVSLAMVFALLFAAIFWNLGTWFLGLPASSSHTLIGAILGIGLANAYVAGIPLSHGVNWTKAGDIGMALLISPLVGFTMSAILLVLARALLKHPDFHRPPAPGSTPPWRIRGLLILTSSGVSLSHGSNDGQKGVGLIMLILISVLPGHFAIRPTSTPEELQNTAGAARHIHDFIEKAQLEKMADGPLKPTLVNTATAAEIKGPLAAQMTKLGNDVMLSTGSVANRLVTLSTSPADRFELRSQIMKLEQSLGKLEKTTAVLMQGPNWAEIKKDRKQLMGLTDYAPAWAIVIIALALGLGTTIGWKRIVVTVGERIGKSHLTYAQGASAELVAMSTIGISAVAGLPVSTTHVLSSGIAGTMVADRSGLQRKTATSILLAWILTLPVAMLLSAGLFLLFLKIFA